MYCNRKCKNDEKRARRYPGKHERAAQRQAIREAKAQAILQKQAEKTQRKEALEAKRNRPCPICQGPRPTNRKFCSPICARQSEAFKATKRAHKAKRRIPGAKSLDPYKVFDRDGWSCQLCGVPTPKHLRASYEPDAPELDHITPISRGGDHSESNLRCACRACNGAKGSMLDAELERIRVGLPVLSRPTLGLIWAKRMG